MRAVVLPKKFPNTLGENEEAQVVFEECRLDSMGNESWKDVQPHPDTLGKVLHHFSSLWATNARPVAGPAACVWCKSTIERWAVTCLGCRTLLCFACCGSGEVRCPTTGCGQTAHEVSQKR